MDELRREDSSAGVTVTDGRTGLAREQLNTVGGARAAIRRQEQGHRRLERMSLEIALPLTGWPTETRDRFERLTP